MDALTYRPIGVIHSPFSDPKDVPIQATAAKGIRGTLNVFPQYTEGLRDLEGFSHLILLYHFHLAKVGSLTVKPFLDDKLHGIFATRAPPRPNPIGLSIVELTAIQNNILHIQDIDIIDGTPLLDIKPYIPKFDYRETSKIGWFSDKLNKLAYTKDDGRFCKPEHTTESENST